MKFQPKTRKWEDNDEVSRKSSKLLQRRSASKLPIHHNFREKHPLHDHLYIYKFRQHFILKSFQQNTAPPFPVFSWFLLTKISVAVRSCSYSYFDHWPWVTTLLHHQPFVRWSSNSFSSWWFFTSPFEKYFWNVRQIGSWNPFRIRVKKHIYIFHVSPASFVFADPRYKHGLRHASGWPQLPTLIFAAASPLYGFLRSQNSFVDPTKFRNLRKFFGLLLAA